TTLATCAAMMGWLAVEKLRDGHATSLGAASGVVAGLVAITPACGNLVPWSAMVLGLVAGGLCALAVGLKYKLGYDDSLDVVGVHLVGGLVGTIGVGFLASNDGGLLTGGGPKQLVVQVVVALFAIIWSAIATLVVGLLVKAVIGLRLEDDSEVEGIDFVEHGEAAYDFGAGGGARRTSSLLGTGAPAPAPAPTASEVNA
ncbi:ammonia channel protein, partial [Pimelobacter simplex]|nr:ammonia channel protein [Pimelobacter simplex]